MSVERPNQAVVYVDANGRLTLEGIKLFLRLIDKLDSLEARIAALEP